MRPKTVPGRRHVRIPVVKRTMFTHPPSGLSDAPRRPKRPRKPPQDGPRGPQDGPATVQYGPKTAQEVPKTAQEGSKTAPRGAQEGNQQFKNLAFRPHEPQGAPRAPQQAANGPQETAKTPQGAHKRPPGGPQKTPRRFRIASRHANCNALRAYNLTLPRDVLTILLGANVLLPRELFRARCERQQPLHPFRLICHIFRGDASLITASARYSCSFRLPVLLHLVAGRKADLPEGHPAPGCTARKALAKHAPDHRHHANIWTPYVSATTRARHRTLTQDAAGQKLLASQHSQKGSADVA